MADPELVRVMDYILNRCDEGAIEALAAAVVRRRRDLTAFGGMGNLPDPGKMARELSSRMGIGENIDSLKDMVRSMAVRIIQQEAPELTEAQAEELTRTWFPGSGPDQEKRLPAELLDTMIGQFIAYSLGRMGPEENAGLRAEMGEWPERYWKSFPPVICRIITDFLKGEMTEGDFNGKIRTALSL